MFAKSNTRTRKIKPTYEMWVPHSYQVRATDFLLDRGSAALFLDPGLGKTSITLNAFVTLQEEGEVKRMLVVAPLRVCQLVWEQEAKRWEQFRHLKFTLLHGPSKENRLRDDSDVFLINPEGVKWLCDMYWGRSLPFDIVTIDELTKFKNAQSIRHKSLLPRLKRVRRRWGLTGTPIPNGYLDLFGQMKILDDGASLGQYYSHFRNKYFEKDYTGFNWDLRRGSAKAIEAAIKPYVLRMSAEDYLELPQLIEDIRTVQMPAKARKRYEQMKNDLITELEGETIEAGNAAAAYSKLKQMANGAVYHGDDIMSPRKVVHLHDAKIEAIGELIEELSGTPLLVGYEFNHDLHRLRKALGADIPYLGSGVSGKKAAEIERAWNNGELPVLLAHPASAGHGLNFQRGNACHIAWFSTTWDYELYDQFLRRVLRQGNNAPRVFNHIFIVENTIDIKTRDAILNKGMTQTAFFDALNAEIYQDGKTAAPTNGAHSTEKEHIMVRKLSRKSKKQDDYEEPEDEMEEDEEEEEEQPKRRTRRSAKSSGTKRKLRGRKAAKEEPEEDEDEDEEDEDEDEKPARKKARGRFSKAVREKLDEDEDEDEDGEEEDDGEEEEEEKPAPRKRRAPSRAKKAAEPEEVEDDDAEEEEEQKAAPKKTRSRKPAAKATTTTTDAPTLSVASVAETALAYINDAFQGATPTDMPALTHALMNVKAIQDDAS